MSHASHSSWLSRGIVAVGVAIVICIGLVCWYVAGADTMSPSGMAAGHDHSLMHQPPGGFFENLWKVYVPRRVCMYYERPVIWLHLVSDLVIAAAYYSIPVALVYFVRRRRDIGFTWVYWMFAAFIFTCGTTHLFGVLDLWHPLYKVDGIVKLITAVFSVVTAVALWPLIPKALALPSVAQLESRVRERTGELAAANDTLRREAAARTAAELERRAAEEAVRASEQQLRSYLDNAGDAIYVLESATGRTRRANARACHDLGYSMEELLELPATSVEAKLTAEEVAEALRHLVPGEVRTVEGEHRRKDGTVFPVEIRLSSLAPAQPELVLAMVRDVTERQRVEEAVRQSEERFRAIYEHAGLGIVEAEPNGRFIAANDYAMRLLGYCREEFLGRTVHEMTYPEDHARSDELNAALLAGRTHRLEYEKRYLKQDGTPLWSHVTVSVIRDHAGQPLRLIGTLEDISERKRAEEALVAAKATAEQAKDAAETANKAKDHFLAVLSHELRNPLNAVLATASMLRDDARFDADTREQLEIVCRNVELEARLIDDLLDVTRIERGKVELDRHPIELCMVIRRAAEVCRPDIVAKKLEFGIDPCSTPCWVNADAARLQQVFWNLLKNSVKFTSAGGCVGVRCRPEGEGFVVAEVNDSGVGFEPEALGRIFNAFEQAERSLTRQFGGLGLGLAISKALVEMHGGSIEAHSAGKGRGATFRVRLPVVAPPAATVPAAPGRAAGPCPCASVSRPLRVLLVEDHEDTVRIMCRLLSANGWHVEAAGDVATGLQLAKQQPFDLLLSDLGLPDGNGLDLMRSLRAAGIHLPGIAISGYGQQQDVEQSRAAGFAMHLTKPVNPSVLLATIRQLTLESGEARACAAHEDP